jgi:hypothetical protein
MNKSYLFAALALTASVSISRATTINFGAVPTARQVVDASDAVLSSATSLVWAGTFASTSFSLNPNLNFAANVAAIQAAGQWKQFTLNPATGTPDTGIVNTLAISSTQPGRIGGTLTDTNGSIDNTDSVGAAFFNGKPLYLWVFNASTVSGASQMGIFRATTANTAWTFPQNLGGVGDVATLSTTPGATSVIAAINGIGTGATGAGTLKLSSLPVIPEPSTMGFGILTTLAVISRRQRRK